MYGCKKTDKWAFMHAIFVQIDFRIGLLPFCEANAACTMEVFYFFFHFKRIIVHLTVFPRISSDAINDRWMNHVIMPKMNRNDNCHYSLTCQNVYLWYRSPHEYDEICRKHTLIHHTVWVYDMYILIMMIGTMLAYTRMCVGLPQIHAHGRVVDMLAIVNSDKPHSANMCIRACVHNFSRTLWLRVASAANQRIRANCKLMGRDTDWASLSKCQNDTAKLKRIQKSKRW